MILPQINLIREEPKRDVFYRFFFIIGGSAYLVFCVYLNVSFDCSWSFILTNYFLCCFDYILTLPYHVTDGTTNQMFEILLRYIWMCTFKFLVAWLNIFHTKQLKAFLLKLLYRFAYKSSLYTCRAKLNKCSLLSNINAKRTFEASFNRKSIALHRIHRQN